MNSSPDRGSFQKENLLKRVEEGDTTIEHAQDMIEFHNKFAEMRAEREAQEEWKQHNLEYDLRSTEWICNKAKASEAYAQNLYAAMCNQDWQKNDVWPLLAGQTYSCSWRYAGGIVADMREEGDYIDWYCSGIRSDWTDEEYTNASKEQQERYLYIKNHFVGEGFVTKEIQEDLLKLGWLPVNEDK